MLSIRPLHVGHHFDWSVQKVSFSPALTPSSEAQGSMSSSISFSIIAITATLVAFTAAAQDPTKAVTKKDLQSTDKDVTDKLNQLHKVIDALQETVKGLNDGYDQHARQNAEKMQQKFAKLTSVITKLGKENNKLYNENKQLRQGKMSLVDKISGLEVELKKRAEESKNAGSQMWLRDTAAELKQFLEESGLENFASPQFSPLIAGIVSNGVIIAPLSMIGLFLLKNAKHLTTLRVVMALNLFDLGFVVSMITSCMLLVGDAFEGLKHISEVNFMFIQLVLAVLFWVTCGFLVAAIVQNRKCTAWRYVCLELVIRGVVGFDYTTRVWSPVMDREDVSIALPPLTYMVYLCASVASLHLTGKANRYSRSLYRLAPTQEEEGQSLPVVAVAQRDE